MKRTEEESRRMREEEGMKFERNLRNTTNCTLLGVLGKLVIIKKIIQNQLNTIYITYKQKNLQITSTY